MKNTFLFAAFAATIALTACDKDSPENNNGYGAYVSSHIELRITDATGTDLLEGTNAYTENDIDIIYYDANGTEKIFYDPMLGSPKRVLICGNEPLSPVKQRPWVRLFLNNPSKDGEITTTLVRFGKNPIDTFKAEWIVDYGNDTPTYAGNATFITKVWLNDELIYDRSETVEELPVIVRPKTPGSSRSGGDNGKGNDNVATLDGIWEGTTSTGKHTNPAVVTLANGRYECRCGMYPDVGRFSVSGNKITFSAEGIYPAIVLLTDILDGEYRYTLQGDRLTLVADDGDCRREYTLTKHRN